jgi:hypothetical protein
MNKFYFCQIIKSRSAKVSLLAGMMVLKVKQRQYRKTAIKKIFLT